MTKVKNPQDRVVQLFDQKKCWTIEGLTRSLDYSIISIRRFPSTLTQIPHLHANKIPPLRFTVLNAPLPSP